MTLNSGIFRTLVASLILLLAFAAVTNVAQAREIRIFPVPVPAAPCAPGAYTACDLVRAAAGFAPTTGPDAGITPQPGDTLVLEPGVYTLLAAAAGAGAVPGIPANGTGPVIVPGVVSAAVALTFSGFPSVMANLEIRSRDGASVTVIQPAAVGGLAVATESCVIVAADNVTIGGDTDDQGLGIQGCRNGLLIGNPLLSVTYGVAAAVVGAPLNVSGGGGNEDVVVQHNFIQNNGNAATGGDGILIIFAGAAGPLAVENLRIDANELRRNGAPTPAAGGYTGGVLFAGNGLYIDPTVTALGGSSEDEGIFITRNTFDSNSLNGVAFANTGDQEQVVFQQNFIVRNGDNGVIWAPNVTQLEDILFESNLIMFNGFQERVGNAVAVRVEPVTFGAGVVFANNGQIEETYFVNNHDDEFEEGITGNAGSGVLFVNGFAFPTAYTFGTITAAAPGATVAVGAVGVQDIDNLMFDNNVINENGDGTAVLFLPYAAGPAGGPQVGAAAANFVPFDGVTFLNSGDLDPVTFTNNNVRLNAGSGVTIGLPGNAVAGVGAFQGVAHPGDYDGNLVENNVFWNNGTGGNVVNVGGAFFPHGDGFAVFSANDINDAIFRDNEAKENFNNGIFLGSVGNDVTGARFYNNKLNKNGVGTVFLGVGAPTSDGLEISTFGDINDFVWDGGEALDNGGNGINLDANNNTLANVNYGIGPAGATPVAIAGVPVTFSAVAVNLADLDDALITNGIFSTNGSSAPIGAGNGIIGVADKISQIDINNVEGNRNDDHGVLLTSVDDMDNISVSDATFEANDRNHDSVGSGLFFDSTDDMDNVSATNVTANANHIGFRFDVKGENGRDLSVTNSTANDNDEEGALFDGSDDLSDVLVDGNTFHRNNIGVTLRSTDRGSNLVISNNDIAGDNGAGIGVQLEAIETSVTGNSIRNNSIGIDANRAENSVITGNNIARNEDFGIDALGLKPGETIDASNNWWGEPSGPKADGNPNGLGDRLTDKVSYEPFLGEPAVATDVNFQIIDFNVPETGEVGTAVTITATVRNNGSEEGTQNLGLSISGGEFVNNETVSRTLNPATEVSVSFTVNFPRGGSYTVTLSTQNDTAEATIDITGPTGLTIEQVCDANDNNRIDDDEILTCIGFWVTGEEVPGTGQTISDSKILFLIELWVTNGDISTLPASAARTQSWVDQVVSFFAPAARIQHSASVSEVAPGGSFTVTTTVNANEAMKGLLLSEQLPQGWTISNVSTDGAFFKANENKWLWVNAGNVTVSYTVNVPANTAEGTYTLSGLLNSANGFTTANAVSVRVANSEALSVNSVAFANGQFVAQGSGITGLDVQVFNLGGSLVFSGQSTNGALGFNGLSNDGQILANGVYLYAVTVKGTDGQQVRTNIGKMVVLR